MEEYPSHFFSNLMNIYADIDSSYPDMTLHCVEDGTKLKCHRIILSASSAYFRNVFGWDTSDVIDVHSGITGDTMEIVLKYIYSGKISLTLENVHDVLVASNFFGILHIVNQCIKLLQDNFQIGTCLDTLLFSWQLDLSKLTASIIPYIAQNFSEVLNDINRMSSIPVSLMSLVLKSNDLVIRNKQTSLPTRPVEREKGVVDFILLYTKCLDQYSDEDIDLLLSCVKWQFLDNIDETTFILDHFAASLDNGGRKDEVKRWLPSKHKDWYRPPEPQLSDATLEDKEMYGPRIFSCSQLFWLDPMGEGNKLTGNSTPFKIVAGQHEYINRIDLISRQWDGHNIIGGMKIHITSPERDPVCHHFGISEDAGIDVHPIVLSDGEHIIAVNGKSERLIDEIGFETSKSRWFGPFGGGVGSRQEMMGSLTKFHEEGKVYDQHTRRYYHSYAPAPRSRIPLDTILVGMSGTRVLDQDDFAITNLRFCFRLMCPDSSFFITNQKKWEIDTMDAYQLQGQTCQLEVEYDVEEDYDRMDNYNELCALYYDD